MSSLGVACSLWVCLWPQLMCLWPKYVWHGLSGCCVALVGVDWLQWVWHGLSRCGMASVGVKWPEWV